jgi:hypothetical protein
MHSSSAAASFLSRGLRRDPSEAFVTTHTRGHPDRHRPCQFRARTGSHQGSSTVTRG